MSVESFYGERKANRLRRALAAPSLSHDLYSAIIERWNAMKPHERRERAAACRDLGHDLAMTPLGCRMCRRCVSYVD